MTKCVTRGTPWGNPFYVVKSKSPVDGFACGSAEEAVAKYEDLVLTSPRLLELIRRWLRGWNLACYCKPGEPCHGDLLLKIANE